MAESLVSNACITRSEEDSLRLSYVRLTGPISKQILSVVCYEILWRENRELVKDSTTILDRGKRVKMK